RGIVQFRSFQVAIVAVDASSDKYLAIVEQSCRVSVTCRVHRVAGGGKGGADRRISLRRRQRVLNTCRIDIASSRNQNRSVIQSCCGVLSTVVIQASRARDPLGQGVVYL